MVCYLLIAYHSPKQCLPMANKTFRQVFQWNVIWISNISRKNKLNRRMQHDGHFICFKMLSHFVSQRRCEWGHCIILHHIDVIYHDNAPHVTRFYSLISLDINYVIAVETLWKHTVLQGHCRPMSRLINYVKNNFYSFPLLSCQKYHNGSLWLCMITLMNTTHVVEMSERFIPNSTRS